MLLALLFACTGTDTKPTDTDTDTDTDPTDTGTTDTDTGDPADDEAWIDAETLSVTLSFATSSTEPGAPAACTYVRRFEGIEIGDLEDQACPDCRVAFVGLTELDPDSEDCYDRWYPDNAWSPADRIEVIGWSGDGFLRSYVFPLQSLITPDGWELPLEGETTEFTYETTVGLGFIEASVSLTRGAPISRPDPDAARTAPYTCGWPQNDPGDLDDGSAAVGALLPREAFEDQCGEPFNVRDLYGQNVLFQYVWSDCDACVHTALAAQALAATRDDLTVVTLFFGSDAGWAEAKETYGGIGPVLRDLGYGGAMNGLLNPGTVTPSRWWLVDTEQTIVLTGWGTSGLTEIADAL